MVLTAFGALHAAQAAGQVPPAPAVQAALRDMESKEQAVREQAAVRLGRLADRAAVPALVRALTDPAPAVRRAAARSLASTRDPAAGKGLMAALSDDDANVRAAAAFALGEIKSPTTGPALLKALGDPQWAVRDQAAWALREIGWNQSSNELAALLKAGQVQSAHVGWLLRGRADQPAAALAALFKSNDAALRARVVEALGALGGEAAVPPLAGALEDAETSVRIAAVCALSRMSEKDAEAALAKRQAVEKDPAVLAVLGPPLPAAAKGGLWAHWSFDDGKARDVTGGGSDGQFKGCKAEPGKVGKAVRCGPDAYVELGKPQTLAIADRPFTICAWIKSEAAGGVVVARGGAFQGFSLHLKGGKPGFGIRRAQEEQSFLAVAPGAVATGRWVHLAGVVGADAIELYVDGVRVARTKTPGPVPGNCGQPMEIGADLSNSCVDVVEPFRGLIDEVKMFDKALTAEEIAAEVKRS